MEYLIGLDIGNQGAAPRPVPDLDGPPGGKGSPLQPRVLVSSDEVLGRMSKTGATITSLRKKLHSRFFQKI